MSAQATVAPLYKHLPQPHLKASGKSDTKGNTNSNSPGQKGSNTTLHLSPWIQPSLYSPLSLIHPGPALQLSGAGEEALNCHWYPYMAIKKPPWCRDYMVSNLGEAHWEAFFGQCFLFTAMECWMRCLLHSGPTILATVCSASECCYTLLWSVLVDVTAVLKF